MSTEARDDFVIAPQKTPSLPIVGSSQRFPINRIFCIGRNYAAHAVEMGHDPSKEPPFFFFKHAGAVSPSGEFPYPSETTDVHYEAELVVALHKGGANIAPEAALDHIWGYGVGIDMTRRDLQAVAKEQGRPWEVAKSFDNSAPCSALIPVTAIGHPQRGRISLAVNGEIKQDGNLDQMIWKTPDIIAILSQYFELFPGDMIMTGTPSGVGPVQRGDTMIAEIEGLGALTVAVK